MLFHPYHPSGYCLPSRSTVTRSFGIRYLIRVLQDGSQRCHFGFNFQSLSCSPLPSTPTRSAVLPLSRSNPHNQTHPQPPVKRPPVPSPFEHRMPPSAFTLINRISSYSSPRLAHTRLCAVSFSLNIHHYSPSLSRTLGWPFGGPLSRSSSRAIIRCVIEMKYVCVAPTELTKE